MTSAYTPEQVAAVLADAARAVTALRGAADAAYARHLRAMGDLHLSAGYAPELQPLYALICTDYPVFQTEKSDRDYPMTKWLKGIRTIERLTRRIQAEDARLSDTAA